MLRIIAKDGPDAFFRGEIADAIDADMRAHGGLLRRADLEKLQTSRNKPLSATYRNSRVTTNQAPGGGIMLLEMLRTLENFDLKSIGHNSVEYIRVVAEAMKAATRDKDLFIGDPSFVDVPTDRLISKEHCAEIAEGIKRGDKVNVVRLNAGLPSKDTTQVSICDADGNCISMTHSLGLPSGVITEGLGFMYNGCMGVFDPRPGRAGSLAPEANSPHLPVDRLRGRQARPGDRSTWCDPDRHGRASGIAERPRLRNVDAGGCLNAPLFGDQRYHRSLEPDPALCRAGAEWARISDGTIRT